MMQQTEYTHEELMRYSLAGAVPGNVRINGVPITEYVQHVSIPAIEAELARWPTSPVTVSPAAMRELLQCFHQIQRIKAVLP